jgi:uncharacterized protein (DUF169 family)
MTLSLEDYNGYGKDLEWILKLKTSPLAVKMLEKEEDIPEGSVRPKRDRGYHLAQCQAFGLSRRDKDTIAMLKEDNWCPGPLMTYGLVEMKDEPGRRRNFESFEYGKYIGIVTAPLLKTNFVPDLVLVYSNTAQLRSMLLSLSPEDQAVTDTAMFSWSCYNSIVKPMLTGKYFIVMPDQGEYERALGTDDEMMFSIPAARFGGFMENFIKAQDGMWGHDRITPALWPDFPQPDIYKNVFKQWGLDTD